MNNTQNKRFKEGNSLTSESRKNLKILPPFIRQHSNVHLTIAKWHYPQEITHLYGQDLFSEVTMNPNLLPIFPGLRRRLSTYSVNWFISPLQGRTKELFEENVMTQGPCLKEYGDLLDSTERTFLLPMSYSCFLWHFFPGIKLCITFLDIFDILMYNGGEYASSIINNRIPWVSLFMYIFENKRFGSVLMEEL